MLDSSRSGCRDVQDVSQRVGRVVVAIAATMLIVVAWGRGGRPLRSQQVAAPPAPTAATPGQIPPAPSSSGPGVPSEPAEPQAPDLTAGLVGSNACRECHPGESAAHSRSGHARTLRPAGGTAVARWLDGKKVADPERPGASWTYALAHGTLEAEHAENGKFHCIPLDFAVGSGMHGMTFVTLTPPPFEGGGLTGREHRLSYLADGTKMDVTPGQGKDDSMSHRPQVGPIGRTMETYELAKCLGCHATVTSRESSLRVDRAAFVPNVGCERCHGPGENHIAAARRGAPDSELQMTLGSADRPGSPTQQIVLCGQCHRNIDNVSPSQIDERNGEIARFQPLGLELSACFKRGRSGLSCMSCHDPHARISEQGPARYENVCRSCHTTSLRSVCPVSPETGCIGCHMPRRTVSVVFQFTDHWIRKPKQPPAQPKAKP